MIRPVFFVLTFALTWIAWRASLLLGAIWAVWHLPLFFMAGASAASVDPLSFSGSAVAWGTVAISWLIVIICLFQMRGASIATLMDRPQAGGPALGPVPAK